MVLNLLVPESVEVFRDHLLVERRFNQKQARAATFFEFTRLDRSDDINEKIRQFVAKWGPLAICEKHGLPHSHSLPYRSLPGSARKLFGLDEACFPQCITRSGGKFMTEPLTFWRRQIKLGAALVRIGADLGTGGKGQRADWQVISPNTRGIEPWKNVAMGRVLFAEQIQRWIDIAGLRPLFLWNKEQRRWTLPYEPPSGTPWLLFPWLTIRLVAEICGGRATLCPYCQREYYPARLPGENQDHCCGDKDCKRAYFTNYKRKRKLSV